MKIDSTITASALASDSAKFWKLSKQKINFMMHSYATRLSDVFFAWGDKIVIGILFGFSLLGDFYFAFQYLGTVHVFFLIFARVFK